MTPDQFVERGLAFTNYLRQFPFCCDYTQTFDLPEVYYHRPTWRIALRQVLRARALGIRLDWLTFDEDDGSKPGSLRGLDEQRLPYAGEVPKSFRCFTAPPGAGQKGHRADHLVRHSPAFHQQPWQTFQLARQTVGEQGWRAKATRVWLAPEGTPDAGTHWFQKHVHSIGVDLAPVAYLVFDLLCRADHAGKVRIKFPLELASLIEKAFGQDGKPLRAGIGVLRRQGRKSCVELAQQLSSMAKLPVVGNHGLTLTRPLVRSALPRTCWNKWSAVS